MTTHVAFLTERPLLQNALSQVTELLSRLPLPIQVPRRKQTAPALPTKVLTRDQHVRHRVGEGCSGHRRHGGRGQMHHGSEALHVRRRQHQPTSATERLAHRRAAATSSYSERHRNMDTETGGLEPS